MILKAGKSDLKRTQSFWFTQRRTALSIGCALSFLEDNGNVAVEEAMAVDNRFGKYGIASALLREAEKQAAIKLGSHLIARNSIEEAEGFQQKCGYTGYFESRCKSTLFKSCQRLIPDIRWLSRTYMMKKPISFA